MKNLKRATIGLMNMELKLERPQRVVEYLGLQLIVPHDTKFLSTGADGIVQAHYETPWYEPCYYEGYELGEVAKVDLPDGFRWEDSLRQYQPDKI